MPKSKTRGGYTAADIAKVILLIFAVMAVLAAIVFGIYYLSNGFGGDYSTFVTSVNGKNIMKDGDIELPSGSELKVTSISDYTVKVVAAETDSDFEITAEDEAMNFSELAGKDLTAGFTFTETDGVITVEYGSLSEILSAALGEEVTVDGEAEGNLFTLVIESGKSSLALNFGLVVFADVSGLIVTPDHIVF